MDSCHLFNFLFGTRKATTELRKHFRTSVKEATCKTDNSSSSGPNGSQTRGSIPSPLKQIKLKIANLADSAQRTLDQDNCRHDRCASDCGTYRAVLVEPSEANDTKIEATDGQIGNDRDLPKREELTRFCDRSTSDVQALGSIEATKKPTSSINGDIVSREETSNESRSQITSVQETRAITSLDSVFWDESFCSASNDTERIETYHADGNDQETKTGTFTDKNDKNDTKSIRVRNLVQSFEISKDSQSSQQSSDFLDTPRTPIKLRWPPEGQEERPKSEEKLPAPNKPPKKPPKSNRLKLINIQLRQSKPTRIDTLFQDEQFLVRFFSKLEPIDRCTAAQVCRLWRNILYSNHAYWRDLISVIDCTQLRREHLLECILNTLQSARLRYHNQLISHNNQPMLNGLQSSKNSSIESNHLMNHQSGVAIRHFHTSTNDIDSSDLDQDEVWRIQELCQRFTRGSNNYTSRSLIAEQQHQAVTANGMNQHQHDIHQSMTSKSSSIPSQISSTLSSASISSLLSPLSESSRVDSIKERLYSTLDDRGFEAICLYGASDDDVEDLVSKTPPGTHKRITIGRLDNCWITDRGLELFISTFSQIQELEINGCNEITNSIELKLLQNLRRLIITDCINIADGLASRLVLVFSQLNELVIQAYHLTDAFLEYISLNSDTNNLYHLELSNCKEITNHSMLTIAKHFRNVKQLSISGSTKVSNLPCSKVFCRAMARTLGWLRVIKKIGKLFNSGTNITPS